MIETPQQACTAPKTIAAVSQLLAQGAVDKAGDYPVLLTAPMNVEAWPQTFESLWKRGLIEIEEITLTSADKETKVVRCSGTLKMDLKTGVRQAAGHPALGAFAGDVAEVPIVYERQPEASGSNYVYRIVSADDYSRHVRHGRSRDDRKEDVVGHRHRRSRGPCGVARDLLSQPRP